MPFSGGQLLLAMERGSLQIPPTLPASRAGGSQSPKPAGPVCSAGHGAHCPHPSQHYVPCRLIELHSPDSRNTLILRCKDTATAHSWFTALHANITALLPQVLAELNAMLGTGGAVAGGREVKHIAWLAEQVGVTDAALGTGAV